MDLATVGLGPEVETVEAVNYFGMDMGKLAFYEVHIKTGEGDFWKVRRRYQMFADLHAQLEKDFNCVPPLPPKLYDVGSFALARYFMAKDKVDEQYKPEFLARRRQDLDKWIKRVMCIPCLSCYPVTLSFLEADRREALKTWSAGICPIIKGVTLEEATQVLAKAHMENPLWKHILPLLESKDLFEALNQIFSLFTKTCFEYGYAIAIKEGPQISAVALVIPPGSTVSHIDLMIAGLAKCAFKIGSTAAATLRQVYQNMEEHHESIMGRKPHWFLWQIVTDSNVDGKDHKQRLMNKVLEMVDNSELPCYMECTDPTRDADFLKEQGFTIEEYHEQPTLAYMLRAERKKGAAAPAAAAVAAAAAPEPDSVEADRGALPSAGIGR